MCIFVAKSVWANQMRFARMHFVKSGVDFFFSRLFERRMFSSKDCFTGQPPGIGHDASHLHTGGARMCRGEGQVQVSLLRRGLEVWCSGGGCARISLMEGVLPSRLWQPDKSWSRRDAAKPCMAACVSMAGSGCGRATSGKLRLHRSNVLQLQSQRQQGDIADPGGVQGRCVPCSSSRPLELCLCIALPACVVARLV